MTEPARTARRVRIYLSEGDRIEGRPGHIAVIEFLRREQAAGATVFHAHEGFGGSGALHNARLGDLVYHLPLVVEWVDSAERVGRLLEPLKRLVGQTLITVEDTEVVQHSHPEVRRLSGRLTAADVMSREVVSVSRDTPVRKLVELQLGKDYRAVPVVEGGVPVGIITNSDLVSRAGLGVRLELLPRLDASAVQEQLNQLMREPRTAGGVMTPSPVTVPARLPLTRVADLMVRKRLKRLPVVDDQGQLVGMISRIDVLRSVAPGSGGPEHDLGPLGTGRALPVAQAMRRDVPTVGPDAPLDEALQAVISTRLNRAIVVDSQRHVLGIVTDAELLERVTPSLRPTALRTLMHRMLFAHPRPNDLAAEQHAVARTARDLMSTRVLTTLETTPLGDVLGTMVQGKEKLIAVVDGDKRLLGVVDRSDLLQGLLKGGG